MPEGRLYSAECGACHTAYAPALLPVSAWKWIMEGLGNHFGDDASLARKEADILLRQLETLSGATAREQPQIASRNAGLPAGEMRITATPYFRYLHDEVPASIWRRSGIGSKANCGACHPRADEGRYPEREIRIPKE